MRHVQTRIQTISKRRGRLGVTEPGSGWAADRMYYFPFALPLWSGALAFRLVAFPPPEAQELRRVMTVEAGF